VPATGHPRIVPCGLGNLIDYIEPDNKLGAARGEKDLQNGHPSNSSRTSMEISGAKKAAPVQSAWSNGLPALMASRLKLDGDKPASESSRTEKEPSLDSSNGQLATKTVSQSETATSPDEGLQLLQERQQAQSSQPLQLPKGESVLESQGESSSFDISNKQSANAHAEKLSGGAPLDVTRLASNPATLVDFILRAKAGDTEQVEQYLQQCIGMLRTRSSPSDAMGLVNLSTTGGAPPSANGSLATALNPALVTDERFDLFDSFLGDFSDSKPATLVLVVNGQLAVVGHLIGKGGTAISRLEKEGNVRIRVEDPQAGSSERRVYVNGALANCTYVQQLITKRVNEKLKQEGIHQDLIKIFLPQDTISHVIGKGGSNIKRVEKDSGARVKIWHEQTLVADSAVGKIMVIHGNNQQRTMAQYLILRQVTNLASNMNRHDPKKAGLGEKDGPVSHLHEGVEFETHNPWHSDLESHAMMHDQHLHHQTWQGSEQQAQGQPGHAQGQPQAASWHSSSENLLSFASLGAPPTEQALGGQAANSVFLGAFAGGTSSNSPHDQSTQESLNSQRHQGGGPVFTGYNTEYTHPFPFPATTDSLQ